MLREFDDLAQEARIFNVRSVLSDWLASEDISGDLAVTRNVTYYVSEIVPFVEKMVSAAQRRVMIVVQSVPPPNQLIRYREEANLNIEYPMSNVQGTVWDNRV